MKKTLLLILSFLFISCSQQKEKSINLNVEQTIKIPIEYVTLRTGVEVSGPDVAAVEEKGYDKLAEIVSLLKQIGYEKKQLEINSGSVSNRSYREKKYEYTSSVKFDLKDLDQLDTIRRALIDKGATSFNVTSYKNSKEDSLYNSAYEKAIGKAYKKADRLLADQTVKAGKILNLSEDVRNISVVRTEQMDVPPRGNDLKINADLDLVNPLYHKKYYTKKINFAITFALEDK